MLAPSLLVPVSLANLPPAPGHVSGVSRVLYIGTSTTTTDETTSTFTGIDISAAPPHPQRVVVLGVYHGVAAACTATVNGIPAYHREQNTAHEFSLHCFQVPCGDTLNVSVSATGSLRKAVAVFVFYPEHHEVVDSGTATANTTANATVSDLKTIGAKYSISGAIPTAGIGGLMVYVGGQHATLGAFSVTFTGGMLSVSEAVDAQLEAAASYTMGWANVTGSIDPASDTGDVTLAETVSGTKRLVAATFYGPKR